MPLFQELLELAQRKFLRQIINYTSSEGGAFPRIIFIDFWTADEIKEHKKAFENMKRRKLEEAQAKEKANVEKAEQDCDSAKQDAGEGACTEDAKSEESETKQKAAKNEKEDAENKQKPQQKEENSVKPEDGCQRLDELEEYEGPGSEFCVRLMCEHEQVRIFRTPVDESLSINNVCLLGVGQTTRIKTTAGLNSL